MNHRRQCYVPNDAGSREAHEMLLEWGRICRHFGGDELVDELAWPGVTTEYRIMENGGSTAGSGLTIPERAIARMSGYERVAVTINTFIDDMPRRGQGGDYIRQILRLWYIHQCSVLYIAARTGLGKSQVYHYRSQGLSEIWLIMKLRTPEPVGAE